MRAAILGFVAGAAWLHNQPVLPERPWLILALIAAVCLVLLFSVTLRTRRRLPGDVTSDDAPGWRLRWWRGLALGTVQAAGVAVLGGLLGFYWAAALAQQALGPSLAKADEGRDFIVVGTIDNLPYVFDGGVRFNFAVERTETPGAAAAPAGADTPVAAADGAASSAAARAVPPKIAISWYANLRGAPAPVPDLLPGERWRLKVRLQRPHGNANPYGFDYELWLLEQGVRATGYVRAEGKNEKLDQFVFSPMNLIERARSGLRSKIQRALKDKPYAGVIVALAIGDQRGIPLVAYK